MFQNTCGAAWGSGAPGQLPSISLHSTANIRVSGPFSAHSKLTRTQIHVPSIAVTAYTSSRPSCAAASPFPSREQEDSSSTSGADVSYPNAQCGPSATGGPRAASPVGRDPYQSDIDARLSARLVLLAADNAACLTSSQLYDLVHAIRRGANDTDRGLQLPRAAVERLIQELRRRRHLAALLDLPDIVLRGPNQDHGSRRQQPKEAASRPAGAAAVVSTLAATSAVDEAEEPTGPASAPQCRSEQHPDMTAVPPAGGGAAKAMACVTPPRTLYVRSSLAGGSSSAAGAGASGRRPMVAAAAATSVAQAQASPATHSDLLGQATHRMVPASLKEGTTGLPAIPPASGHTCNTQQELEAQGQLQRPSLSGLVPAAEEDPSKGFRVRKKRAAIVPKPVAEEQPTHATRGLLRPQTAIKRLQQRVHRKLRHLGGECDVMGLRPSVAAVPALVAAQQQASGATGDGDSGVDASARTQLQQEQQQAHQQEQRQEGEAAGNDADFRRFFAELHNVGAGLESQEALMALETCTVAGVLPPRLAFEALLRSVRRAAAVAVAVPHGAAKSGEQSRILHSDRTLVATSCDKPDTGGTTGTALRTAPSSRRPAPPLPTPLSPTRVVAVLHGLTRLGQRLSQPLWRDLLSYIEPYLSYTGPQLPRSRWDGAAAAGPAARRRQEAALNAYDLVDLATAMAAAGCNPSTQFLEAHAAAVLRFASQLTGRQAARLLWSYASLDYRPPFALQGALATTLSVEVVDMEPGELARGVQALVLQAAAVKAAAMSGSSAAATAAAMTVRRCRAVWAAGARSSRAGAGRDGSFASHILNVAATCKQQHDAVCEAAALEAGIACNAGLDLDGTREAVAGGSLSPGNLWSLMPAETPMKGKRSRCAVGEAGMAVTAVAAQVRESREWVAVGQEGSGGGAGGRAAAAQLRALQEQNVFLSWLMTVMYYKHIVPSSGPDSGAGGGVTTVAAGANAGGCIRLLPPLPGSLCADNLAMLSRLLPLLLQPRPCEPGMLAPDEAWARQLQHQIALLAPALRPADLVPVVQLIYRLYDRFPTLLANSLAGDVAVARRASVGDSGFGGGQCSAAAALHALITTACSSMECLSYGQTVALYSSVTALAAEPHIQALLGAMGSTAAVSSTAVPLGLDAVLLARAATSGRSIVDGIVAPGGDLAAGGVGNPSSGNAAAATAARGDDSLAESARWWLLSLLGERAAEEPAAAGDGVRARVFVPGLGGGASAGASSTQISAQATANGISSGRIASCGVDAGAATATASNSAAAITAVSAEAAAAVPGTDGSAAAGFNTPTAPAATAAEAPGRGMVAVATAAAIKSLPLAEGVTVTQGLPRAFHWPAPSGALQRSTRPEDLTLLAPPRRPPQNTPSARPVAAAATVPVAAASTAGAAPARTRPLDAAHTIPRSLTASAATAATAAAAAGANGALQTLIRLLRSCTDARAQLSVQGLQAVQAAWRQHLQLQPWPTPHQPQLGRGGGDRDGPPPSVADARVVAELLLAIAVAAPRRAAVRSELLLELAAVLGAGGEGALRKLSPAQLTGCVYAVALAASGDGGDDRGSGGGPSRVGRAAATKRAAVLVAVIGPLLDEVQRRVVPPDNQLPAVALPPPCVAAVCRALSYLSCAPVWPARLRHREAAIAAAARAQLAAARPLSPSSSPSSAAHLRRAIASYMPPLTAARPPPPSMVRYGIWVLRHLDLKVGPTWLERLGACAPRYLRRMHPRVTADWLAVCAARRHTPPRPAMRMAWLHLHYSSGLLSWRELYVVIWSTVRLGVRPPRSLLAAACESVADAAAAADGGSQKGNGGAPDGIRVSAASSASGGGGITTSAEPATEDGGTRRRAVDPGGGRGRRVGRGVLHTASIAVRLLWAVQFDERYTPTPRVITAMCGLLAATWCGLTPGEQSAALWALARLPPLSGSERAVLESGLGGVAVRYLAKYSKEGMNGRTRRSRGGQLETLAPVNAAAALGTLDCAGGGDGGNAMSSANLSRLVWALARLRQQLPQRLAVQLCERLAAATTALPVESSRAATITPEAVEAAGAVADAEAPLSCGLRAKEVVQALYGAARMLLGHSPVAARAAAGNAKVVALRSLLHATLATNPVLLDARSLADALGTLSRFRRALARDSSQPLLQPHSQLPQQDTSRHMNLDPDLDVDLLSRRQAGAGAVTPDRADDWSFGLWVNAALAHAAELFERSALRGLGDRPVPAWCALEVLQAAAYLGAPVGPRLTASAGQLLSLHLPSMPPAQLADVLGCCAAQPSLPADLGWEALQQLVRVETMLAASARPTEEESGSAGGGGIGSGDDPWPALQPDELARAVLAAPQAVAALVAGRSSQPVLMDLVPKPMEGDTHKPHASAPRANPAHGPAASSSGREVWLPPPLQMRRLLAAAVAELACRPADPRVAAMSPDQLSMLVQGVVTAGAAPGGAWLGWVCGLMQARLGKASQYGLLRMCKALEVAEVWPGKAWAQACLAQAAKLVTARRMPKDTERQIQSTLLRLRAFGAAATAAATARHGPGAARPPGTEAAVVATAAVGGLPPADALPALEPWVLEPWVMCRSSGTKTGDAGAHAEAATLLSSARGQDRNNSGGSTGGGVEAVAGQAIPAGCCLEELVATEAQRALQLVHSLHGTFSAATQTVLRSGVGDVVGIDKDTIGGHQGTAGHTVWSFEEKRGKDQPPLRRPPWQASSPQVVASHSAASLGPAIGLRDAAADPDAGACVGMDGSPPFPAAVQRQQEQQQLRRPPDAFSRLLLVYRLAETRVDRVMGLTLKVAALQSAYALHVRRRSSSSKQQQLEPRSWVAQGQARRMGRTSTRREFGWQDEGDSVDDSVELVRAQATESVVFTRWSRGGKKGAPWGMRDWGRGPEQGLSQLMVQACSDALPRVPAEMLSPLAAYLQRQQQVPLPLQFGYFLGGVSQHGRARVRAGARGQEQADQWHSAGDGVGEWCGGGAGVARAGQEGSGLLACLVHVKYCGLLHTFNKMYEQI